MAQEMLFKAWLEIVLLVHCVELVLLLNLFALIFSPLGLTNIYAPLKGTFCSSEVLNKYSVVLPSSAGNPVNLTYTLCPC